MTTDARLTMANLNSRYELLSNPAEVWPLQKELDRIAREQLPQVLAGFLLPQIDPNHTVFRIRNIDIELTVNRQALQNGMLPQLWAKRIALDLLKQIHSGRRDNVAFYASYAHFAAEFIVDLLRGQAWQVWQYQEFSALRHLSTAQATTEFLVSRPAYLPVVASALVKNRVLDQMVQILDKRQCARILKAQLNGIDAQYPASEELISSLSRIANHLSLVMDFFKSIQHIQLGILLQLLAVNQTVAEKDLNMVIQLSHHIALLQNALINKPALRFLFEYNFLVVDVLSSSSMMEDISNDLFLVLSHYEKTNPGKSYLRHLFWAVKQLTPGPPDQDKRSNKKQHNLEDTLDFFSGFAGFAFLLMTIKDSNLHKQLAMQQLRYCLLQMVDEKFRQVCQMDPFWGAFFPITDPEQSIIPWLPIDNMLLQRLTPENKEAMQKLEGSDAWTFLILKNFASRLRGMEESSTSYLCRQFFQRPGHVNISNKMITVSMNAIPLGVVLRMAGFNGWQGKIPWLAECELTFEIPAG